MNSELLRVIENAETLETFDFCDFPLFFSRRTPTGQIFVFFWLSEREGNHCYLVVEQSKDRYQAMRSGRISIREALTTPENGYSLQAEIDVNGGVDWKVLGSRDVPIELMPPEDDFHQLNSDLLPKLKESVRDGARSLSRQLVDLLLTTGRFDSLIAVETFGSVLLSFQRLVDALSTDQNMPILRVPYSIKDESRYYFRETFAGSIGIRLEKEKKALIASEDVNPPGQLLVEIIESFNRSESAVRKLKELNLPSRARAVHFLNTLSTASLAAKCEWASPAGPVASASLPLANMKNSLAFVKGQVDLDRQRQEYNGTLEGVDVHKKTFDFLTDSGERIAGSMSDALAGRNWNVPCELLSTIEETVELNEVTGAETVTRLLVEARILEGGE